MIARAAAVVRRCAFLTLTRPLRETHHHTATGAPGVNTISRPGRTGTTDRFASALAATATLLLGVPALGATEPASTAEVFFIQRHPTTGAVEWIGSGIIWLLLILSVLCVGMLIAMALGNRRDRLAPAALAQDMLTLAGEPDGRARLAARVRSDGSVLGQAAAAALDDPARGPEAMLHAAEDRLDELTLERLRALEPLSIIGNIAPMVGLFGTVYGMILAFREIVTSGGSPDPVGLASGIGTALTTTFWGLIVAIPALAGHALIRNAIDARTFSALRTIERAIGRVTSAESAGRSAAASTQPSTPDAGLS
jgi:biopolymer transport protein ExbB